MENLEGIIIIICITILIILFAGEPDLMDALQIYLKKG